jgi:hypothetical protein
MVEVRRSDRGDEELLDRFKQHTLSGNATHTILSSHLPDGMGEVKFR